MLDVHLLKKPRSQSGGTIVAQCPACAEAGTDKQGDHLVVYPNGQFGCVCHPGPAGKEHRQRIWKLAGDRTERRPPPVIRFSGSR